MVDQISQKLMFIIFLIAILIKFLENKLIILFLAAFQQLPKLILLIITSPILINIKICLFANVPKQRYFSYQTQQPKTNQNQQYIQQLLIYLSIYLSTSKIIKLQIIFQYFLFWGNTYFFKTMYIKFSFQRYQKNCISCYINQMQLASEEIKIRQISQAYLKIEENTQYLTNVFRYSRFKKKIFLKFQNQNVEVKSFFKLIVQTSYLLYTCYVKQSNIFLSQDIFCFHRKDQSYDVYIQYIIELDYNSANQVEQEMINKYFKKYLLDSTNSSSYGEYVIKLIKNYLQKCIQYISYLKNQQKKQITNESQIIRQIQNMQSVLKHLQSNVKKLIKPKSIILCLQQSQLFMQNSILLKIMNNSIYSSIKTSSHNCQIFNYLSQLQSQLSYNKSTPQPKQIQLSIEQCFKYLIKQNIVSSQQSLNDAKSNTKGYILGDVEGKDGDRRFVCRIKIFQRVFQQFTHNTLADICQKTDISLNQLHLQTTTTHNVKEQDAHLKKKIEKSDYLIQFITSKNLICVKYVTDIQLNIQNTDLIMFQCNNISFNWNSVSMELIQRNQSKTAKRKQRFVAFKTLAQFSASQRPLFKILLLIDLVMICAKISEPQLKKTVVKLQDYWKIQQISNKINHVINLFIKKVDRIYKTFKASSIEKTKP